MIPFVNESVGYLCLKIMHHECNGCPRAATCLLDPIFHHLFCEWELSDVNCVFFLGNFQWCICKYTDGPCLDFSGGMFTVSLSHWVFEMMLQACPVVLSLSEEIMSESTLNHAAVCLVAVCTVVCLPPHAVSQKCLHCYKQGLCDLCQWLSVSRWISELVFLNV